MEMIRYLNLKHIPRNILHLSINVSPIHCIGPLFGLPKQLLYKMFVEEVNTSRFIHLCKV